MIYNLRTCPDTSGLGLLRGAHFCFKITELMFKTPLEEFMNENPVGKKRIALDMDEVIADVTPKFLDLYERDFGAGMKLLTFIIKAE